MKLSRWPSRAAVVACVATFLAAQTLSTSAQDTSARLMASLTAITKGDDGAARREAIVTQLRSLDVEARVEPFGEGRAAGANIVVSVPATGIREGIIVVGAHYDRVSVGRGAVDNGAACAALIELLAAFKASRLKRWALNFVFFDREESGLEGSRAFFSNPSSAIQYAINLDIFAYGDTIFATASTPGGVLLRSLQAAGKATGLPVRDVPFHHYPDSDHRSMYEKANETLGIALIDGTEIDGVLRSFGVLGLPPGRAPRILRIIHTPADILAEVRPEQMLRGIAFVEELLRTVDRGLGPGTKD